MDIARFDLPRYLSLLPLFQEMDQNELKRLSLGCRIRKFVRGEDIFRTGDPCDELHVTVMGQVKLYAISPSGHEKTIELVGPGSSFAEALMFTGRPYIVNAQALAETLLLSVSKSAITLEIQNDHRFAMRMLAGISRRLHGLVHDIQAYALQNGVQRVIGYLLREVSELQPSHDNALQVELPASKATIASRLSITPEYFSKVLHELEAAKLIEIDKRNISIPSRERLASFQMQSF